MTLLEFDDAPVSQEQGDAQTPTGAAMTAVECQQQIESLKLEIEVLTARRDQAIEDAFKAGIKQYGGYKFVAKKPSATVSERKLAETHPDVMDGYIAWYQETHPAKLSKAELSKYLKTLTDCTDPEGVITDCTEEGRGAPTYVLTKMKEASE